MPRANHEPIHVSQETFAQDVLKAERPVVVDFWAPWCGPCRLIGPHLDRLAGEYGDRITVAKVNADHNPALAQEYGIRGIPTLLVFHQGQLIDQVIGYRGAQALNELFDGLAQRTGPEPRVLH